MSRKSSKGISEEYREVGIHFFRFAKFLRYLKESNATIETVNPANGETIIYRHDKSSDGLPLENLVSDALDIDHEYARDLLSRKLSLSDKQSNKERIRGLGDTIYGITVHKTMGDNSEHRPTPIREITYQYYSRRSYVKGPRFDLSEKTAKPKPLHERDKEKEFTVDPILKSILQKYVNASITGYVDDKDFISQITEVDFVLFPIFEQPIRELKKYLNGKKEKTITKENTLQLKHELLKLTRSYNQVLDRHDIHNSIIPYYRDFAILGSDDLVEKSIRHNFDYPSEDFLKKAASFSPEMMIYFRYEILNTLIEKPKEVSNWPVQFQALLMFCNYELEGVHAVFKELILDELSSIRFTILTKNSHNNSRVQEENLTLDTLLKTLSDYDISDPLDEVFNLRHNHILTTKLYKYPEKYAVTYNYTRLEVHKKLTEILGDFLRKNLYEGLRISEKLLPINRESSILL